MMRLENVWFHYPGSTKWVLRGVNLSINSSKIIIVLGPNASGKTTLLKTIALIHRPQRGRILIDNRDYWSLNEDVRLSVRRRIVYVHEKPILFRSTIIDNLVFPLIIRGIDRGEASRMVENFLSSHGLEKILERRINELSSGEAQIISLLRAILVEPDILVLDEPMNYLDLDKRRLVIEFIKNLRNKGKAIVIATHDYYTALFIGDEFYEIREGKMEQVSITTIKNYLEYK